MILDALLQFDTAANLAQVVGTYNSSNVIDLGLIGIPLSAAGGGARDMGIGDDPALKFFAAITAGFTSGGAGTLQIKVQGAPDNGAGAPGTYYDMLLTPVYALATLTVGQTLMDFDFPGVPPGQAVPRFIRLAYIIAGATMTAGTVVSYIVLDRIDQIQGTTGVLSGYPPGIAIAN